MVPVNQSYYLQTEHYSVVFFKLKAKSIFQIFFRVTLVE